MEFSKTTIEFDIDDLIEIDSEENEFQSWTKIQENYID